MAIMIAEKSCRHLEDRETVRMAAMFNISRFSCIIISLIDSCDLLQVHERQKIAIQPHYKILAALDFEGRVRRLWQALQVQLDCNCRSTAPSSPEACSAPAAAQLAHTVPPRAPFAPQLNK